MSLLSQFYGGSSKKIDIELLVVGGGGGGAQAVWQQRTPGGGLFIFDIFGRAGGGGGGGVFYGTVPVTPGSVCPIVIGSGGNGATINTPFPFPGTIPVTENSPGSPSIFNGDVRYEAVGGGRGAGNNVRTFTYYPADPGGSGGGAIATIAYYSEGESTGVYENSADTQVGIPYGGGLFYGSQGNVVTTPGSGLSLNAGAGGSAQALFNITGITTAYGIGGDVTARGRFPVSYSSPTSYGYGGSGLSPAPTVPNSAPTPVGAVPGKNGVVVVRYPTSYPAAPSFPGGTDISPATPGYRTYQFNSPGSITLP